MKDISLIEKLKDFVLANERDFWNDLTEEQRLEIKQAMSELDQGEKFDYDKVMYEHR